jgi:type VI secretion system protein ImpL
MELVLADRAGIVHIETGGRLHGDHIMIRRLLFILFLYALLVWLLVFLNYSGDTKRATDQGLFWTACGVAALLLWLVLERVIGWWRVRRAQRPAVTGARRAGPTPLHEDDIALLGLLREADQRLAQAPDAKATRALDLPLYLILGPEGTGKTSVLHNSGIEPTLLAGQVGGGGAGVNPTRVANLWLAQESLFLEVSGRVFASEPGRIAEFLSRLQLASGEPRWKAWWKPAQPAASLRAVLLFFDSREFSGTPELSKLDRAAQQVRERLSSAASALGAEFPVYVVLTRLDALPFFGEFFARLPDGDAGQVLGVLTPENAQCQGEERVWAEAATKRLNGYFNSLFLRLNERRLLSLSQELDVSRKPAIYEFPREFKRIRPPLVQFLVDVFKPDPLKAGPRLRGFFFTGTRKAERSGLPDPDLAIGFHSPSGASGATQIFRTDATLFAKSAPKSGSVPLVDRWMFVTDFFRRVLTQDRPTVKQVAPKSKLESYRQIVMGVIACVIVLLTFVWTVSWIRNWRLQSEVRTAIENARRGGGALSLSNLQALDELRKQLEKLEKDDSLSLHWGLYTGDTLYATARKVYFGRLKGLSLDRINQTLASKLVQAEANPQESTAPTYDRLKTHRTITALGCPVDRPLLSRVLKETAMDAHPGLADEQLAQLRIQLDYYVSQLGKKGVLTVSLPEDPVAEAKARTFLHQAGGVEQQLRELLSEVSQQSKPLSVADYADNYQSVLTGPSEISGEYTKRGQALLEELVQKGNFDSGEKCVMGDSDGLGQLSAELQVKDRLRSLYYRRYADKWRDFIGSYNVIHYSGLSDAAKRLDILAGPKSPLLGIIRMAAVNTNYQPPKPGEKSWWEKGAQKVGLGRLVQAKAKGEKAADQALQFVVNDSITMTTADIGRLFQPVLFTTPPDQDLLVNDRDTAYVNGLRDLQRNLEALDRASTAEKAAVIPQARAALILARKAHADLADKFTDVGNEGLKGRLSNLLEQPIRLAESLIPRNPESVTLAKKNGDLHQFCLAMQPILVKYPFSLSQVDATLPDVERGFQPKQGLVWKYVQQSGSDLLVRTPQGWQPNPALQGMKVAPELLAFLERSQQLTSALFAESGMMQKLKYVLRPVRVQGIAIRVAIDGDEFNSGYPLQKTFYWPAPAGAKAGADATMEFAGGASTGFGRFEGIWGIFRLFQNADERSYGTKGVQWSEIRGRGGEPQKLTPPAKVELVEFPGGVDLFNPKFFETLKCPTRAVVAN